MIARTRNSPGNLLSGARSGPVLTADTARDSGTGPDDETDAAGDFSSSLTTTADFLANEHGSDPSSSITT